MNYNRDIYFINREPRIDGIAHDKIFLDYLGTDNYKNSLLGCPESKIYKTYISTRLIEM